MLLIYKLITYGVITAIFSAQYLNMRDQCHCEGLALAAPAILAMGAGDRAIISSVFTVHGACPSRGSTNYSGIEQEQLNPQIDDAKSWNNNRDYFVPFSNTPLWVT